VVAGLQIAVGNSRLMAIACKEGGALKADEAEWVQKGTISGLGNVTRSIS
jgi:hypothetical protein